MRISTGQIFRQSVTEIQDRQKNIFESQKQIATGKKYDSPSDSPIDYVAAEKIKQKSNTIEQMNRGMNYWLETRAREEESALDSVIEKVQDIREKVVGSVNGIQDGFTLDMIASEIDGIKEDVLSIANQKSSNGEYIFGGTKSLDVQPFVENADGDIEYGGSLTSREIMINDSPPRTIPLGQTGDKVFGDAFDVLDGVVEELRNIPADPEAISATLDGLDSVLDRLNSARTDTGIRRSTVENQLEMNADRLLDLEQSRADIEDVDLVEAISQFQLEQTAYEAALKAFAETSRLSLFAFI